MEWEFTLKHVRKFISQQGGEEPYIYDVYMEKGWPHGEVSQIGQMSADSFDFKQKIYCSFLQMEGVAQVMGVSQNWSFFVTVINVWPLNGLKLQPMQALEAVVDATH